MTKTIDIVNKYIEEAKVVENISPVSAHFLVTNIFEFAAQALRFNSDDDVVEIIENINKSICALVAKEFNNVDELAEFADYYKSKARENGDDVPNDSIYQILDVIDEMASCPECGSHKAEYVAELPIIIGLITENLLKLVTLFDVKELQGEKKFSAELQADAIEHLRMNILRMFMLYTMGYAKEGCSVFSIKEKVGD